MWHFIPVSDSADNPQEYPRGKFPRVSRKPWPLGLDGNDSQLHRTLHSYSTVTTIPGGRFVMILFDGGENESSDQIKDFF